MKLALYKTSSVHGIRHKPTLRQQCAPIKQCIARTVTFASGNGNNGASEDPTPENPETSKDVPPLSEEDAEIVVNFLTGSKAPQQTAAGGETSSESSVDAAAEEDLLEGVEPPHRTKSSKKSKKSPATKASAPTIVSSSGEGTGTAIEPQETTTTTAPETTTGRSPSSSSPTAATEADAASADSKNRHRIHKLKDQLVAMVASLDRGFAASKEQCDQVDNLVMELEAAVGPVIIHHEDQGQLEGRWRLIYSSGFASGSLGGARPGPPNGLLPVTLGQVYQDINTVTKELDNCVEFTAKYSLANFGIEVTPPTAKARLRHTFELLGANTVRITYVDTSVSFEGGLSNWLRNVPGIKTPQLPAVLTPSLRSATFDVVLLDKGMRVTRGDRGELRVFLKRRSLKFGMKIVRVPNMKVDKWRS